MPKTIRDQLYSFEHCIQRYKERYGKDLSKNEYTVLCEKAKEMIKDGKYSAEEKTATTEQYIIEVDGVICVYEIERGCITTFLPPLKEPGTSYLFKL